MIDKIEVKIKRPRGDSFVMHFPTFLDLRNFDKFLDKLSDGIVKAKHENRNTIIEILRCNECGYWFGHLEGAKAEILIDIAYYGWKLVCRRCQEKKSRDARERAEQKAREVE